MNVFFKKNKKFYFLDTINNFKYSLFIWLHRQASVKKKENELALKSAVKTQKISAFISKDDLDLLIYFFFHIGRNYMFKKMRYVRT